MWGTLLDTGDTQVSKKKKKKRRSSWSPRSMAAGWWGLPHGWAEAPKSGFRQVLGVNYPWWYLHGEQVLIISLSNHHLSLQNFTAPRFWRLGIVLEMPGTPTEEGRLLDLMHSSWHHGLSGLGEIYQWSSRTLRSLGETQKLSSLPTDRYL